jgi:hypothetical protein
MVKGKARGNGPSDAERSDEVLQDSSTQEWLDKRAAQRAMNSGKGASEPVPSQVDESSHAKQVQGT